MSIAKNIESDSGNLLFKLFTADQKFVAKNYSTSKTESGAECLRVIYKFTDDSVLTLESFEPDTVTISAS